MSLRNDREQADYEAEKFGPPWLDQWGRSPQIDVIDDFAKAVSALLTHDGIEREIGRRAMKEAAE